MIRPFTCVCLLLAGGAGLFLYQSKHRTRVLDHQIEQTMKQVEAARSRIGILQAEWALLNDPQRLAELSDRFLAVKPVAPAQFVTLADLDRRLPAPLPPPAATAASDGEPPADAPAEDAGAAPGSEVAEAQAAVPAATAPRLPIPPVEPLHPRAALAPLPPAIAKAAVHPTENHHVASRRDETAAEARTTLARHAPLATEPPRTRSPAARESVAQSAPVAAPIPLWPTVAAPVLASAAPAPVRSSRPPPSFSQPPPQTTRPVFGTTSAPSLPAGSLLGGAHMAVAPPVPISDAAWSGSR